MFHNSSLATTHLSHKSHSLSSHNGTAKANGQDNSLQPHKENILNAKTPLGKNAANNSSRRRALGDISNRKSGHEKLEDILQQRVGNPLDFPVFRLLISPVLRMH
jgi:hypothetical protein